MPIRPAKTRSCSTRSSGRAACSASASLGSQRPATPSVRSASTGQRLVGLQDRGASRGGQGSALVADELAGAARQQHVRRALGEDDAASVLLGVAVHGAHQLALGRERHLARRAGDAASSASGRRPALRAATSSAPSVGSPWTIHRPSRSRIDALLARSAAASARSSSTRSAPSIAPPSSAPHGARPARSRRLRSAHARWPSRRPARSSRSSSACRSCPTRSRWPSRGSRRPPGAGRSRCAAPCAARRSRARR